MSISGKFERTFNNSIGGVAANRIGMVGSLVAGNFTDGPANPISLNLNHSEPYGLLEYNIVGRTNSTARNRLHASPTNESAPNLDPRVNELADNGGPTLTMTLLEDSPALGWRRGSSGHG